MVTYCVRGVPTLGLIDNTLLPGKYERVYYFHNGSVWGGQGRPLKQVGSALTEQGKESGLSFFCFVFFFQFLLEYS